MTTTRTPTTEDMAVSVSTRGGRTHQLVRPVSMQFAYGHWNDDWAPTLCGRKVSGIGNRVDHNRQVSCSQCLRRSSH